MNLKDALTVVLKENLKIIKETKLPRVYRNILTLANLYFYMTFLGVEKRKINKELRKHLKISKQTCWRQMKTAELMVKMYVNYYNIFTDCLIKALVKELGEINVNAVGNTSS